MNIKKKKILFLSLAIGFLIFSFSTLVNAQTTELPETADVEDNFRTSLPPASSQSLSPCPTPEREPRFFYREKVVHEERQFRAEHPGCGGDIMMRKWQIVGLEIGRCDDGQANRDSCSIDWLNEFVYYYDRFTPSKKGEVFDEVGSWQKAWPSESQWLTEEELEEKYGEPIPFPTCQSDCLQSPPGTPDGFNVGQEDPYYFQNPWLPEILTKSGSVSSEDEYISTLREKNVLGDENALKKVNLPTKLFWWNIPGWKNGWIENGKYQTCDGPEDVACVDSYIIKFDNINREDRPATFHRYEVINKLENEGWDYDDASKIYDELERKNREAYKKYREHINSSDYLDVMRYDRDNIIGCDNCGTEQEIWLETNTFNPLSFDPKIDYKRPQRDWMKNYLLDRFDESAVKQIIREVYNSYGRPAFFRSGTEHNYTLQATCAPHDYLEEEEGPRGPEASYSFKTSDAPELISPLDPNWTSPYDPKKYDPNFDSSRIKAEDLNECDKKEDSSECEEDFYPTEDYEDGYPYPAEEGSYTEESTKLSEFDENPLWNESVENLILQDRVAFREELRWAQQWYQDTPQDKPRPPKLYLMSFGEANIKIDNNDTVLEDCHSQLKSTYEDKPICTYQNRPKQTQETNLNYPLPNHKDRETEFFSLPENRDEDGYSWNIATCRDSSATNCTDFSQMWRFQLDKNEENKLFAPKNINPLNLKSSSVSEDEATTGFPFTLKWDRRFGAKSYVYRIKKAEEDNWQDIEIQKEREIYYDISDIKREVFLSESLGTTTVGFFDLDTEYEWDVKACWDKNINHGIDEENENYYSEVESWVDENKKCSNWRSEDYENAPFRFKTTGKSPKPTKPTNKKKIEVPVPFSWESVPGAKSYIFALYRQDSLMTMASLSEPRFSDNIFIKAIATNKTEYTYEDSIKINTNDRSSGSTFYNWSIVSCAKPIEKEEKITSQSNIEDKEKELLCGEKGDWELFAPTLNHPENLTPGSDCNPQLEENCDGFSISPDQSYQTLSWDPVPSAVAYEINIRYFPYDQSGSEVVKNTIIKKTNYPYDFEEKNGVYIWSVTSCLDEECSNQMKSSSTDGKHIEVKSPENQFKGVVPCGRNTNIFAGENPDLDSRDDCKISHLFVMIGLIIEEILVKLLIPYSLVLLLLYTGYLYYKGLGDPKTMQRVIKVWEFALKGYLLIFLSWVIVGTFLTLIGYQFGTWWKITNLSL